MRSPTPDQHKKFLKLSTSVSPSVSRCCKCSRHGMQHEMATECAAGTGCCLSHPGHLIEVWPGIQHFAALCLSFHIWKVRSLTRLYSGSSLLCRRHPPARFNGPHLLIPSSIFFVLGHMPINMPCHVQDIPWSLTCQTRFRFYT
jgi:hypothetical protein